MLGPFPNYRQTELNWLKRLPDSWDILRTKHVFRLRIEKAPQNNQMELLSIYTHIGVKPRKELEQRGNKASTTDGYWIVKKGDIISNKLLAWMGAVGVSHYEGVTSLAYDILRPIQRCNTDYYHYLFRTPKYLQQFKIRSKGIMDMRLRLYFDQLGQIPVPVPPANEQDSIVLFLNWKTAQINRFIRDKRRLIELLKEQKQNIINQAVTRGLDPNVKLKSSGVEWIGDILEHWEVRRLKFLCHNLNEQTSEKQPGEKYIALEHVESWTGRIPLPDDDITFDSQVKRFQPGDVLFGKLRPYLAKVTRPQIGGVCVGEFLVLRATGDLSADFLEQKLRSKRVIDLIDSSTFGAKMPRADWTFIGDLKFAYPPADEQREILIHIQEKSAEIDQAISRAQREIELMREYCARLIVDVVTGQLDVRGIEVPEVAEEELLALEEDTADADDMIDDEGNRDETD